MKLTPEHRLKLSQSTKGRPHSAEHNKNKIAAMRTPEYRQRMSEIVKARYKDDAFRKSMGESIKKGLNKPGVSEHLSEIRKIHYSNPENRRKMSDSVKNVPHTPEWNKRVSESLKGHVFSVEHRRKIGESNAGEKNYGWLGGVSFLPYAPRFNQRMKEFIKDRDNHCCRLCGATGKLYIHHIDYVKLNCDPSNLISLCLPCHAKTNFNRNCWKEYLTYKNLSFRFI